MRSASRSASAGRSPPSRRFISMKMRSPEGRDASADWLLASRSLTGSMSNPNSWAIRGSRSSRSGSSANTLTDTVRNRRRSRSSSPSYGSTYSPLSKATAIALMVKSRRPRSSSMLPRHPAISTVCSPDTTRQAPCRSDSGNGEPPRSPASRLATVRGSSATTRSMSSTGRPSSMSRTLPPTSQAPSTGARRRMSASGSAVDDDMLHPPPPGRDVTHDLIRDRVAAGRPLLGPDPLVAVAADQHHRVAQLHVAALTDHEGQLIHADRGRHPSPPSPHQHVHPPRQQPRHAVGVPGRHQPDPGRPLGHEPAPVAGALTWLEQLQLRHVALQAQRRRQAARSRVVAERRQPVDRDPAAHGVEPSLGVAERAGAVGNMPRAVRKALGEPPEPLQLAARVAGIVVG